jgi:hypothetical protein
MRHLSPDQVVDVAEGCADAAVAAHGAACASCRAKAESLADAVRLAESDPGAEPSPLFWPHLAARIGDAVRREEVRTPFWRAWGWRLAPIGAAAVLMIAVGVGSRMWTGTPVGGPLVPAMPDGAPAQAAMEPSAEIETADDPSWLLVSALSADVSVEEAEASGALPPPGGADKALLQLDDAERMELARILRAEIRTLGPVMPRGPGA